ncbi:MAG: HD domain-containing protein [Thermoanaerobaculia bacterium]
MAKRVNEPISRWESGDQVQGFALLAKKELRQDRNGREYLDMVLADASGSMVAKVWSDAPALKGDYEAHAFVAFRGLVKSYRDQLQIAVEECREVTEEDRRFGFDERELIPSSPEDVDDLWARLEGLYPGEIRRPELRRLAERALEVHGPALKEHPAAKAMHHAYLGGLLEHTVSMAELALKVAEHYPDVDRDLLLVGTLFHDLGKIRELGAMPANDYTLPGRLVGHVVMGRDLLRECCAEVPDVPEDLQLHLEHLVLSHQGKREYGTPVEPMTLEALVLHFIDDLDSKINQFRNQRRQSPLEVQYLRGLGRYVYLPREPEDPEEARLPEEDPGDDRTAAAPEAPAVDAGPEPAGEQAGDPGRDGKGTRTGDRDEPAAPGTAGRLF